MPQAKETQAPSVNNAQTVTQPVPSSATTERKTTPAPAVQAKTVVVTIANFAFDPATIKIKAGDTVKWINDDPPAHKIIANSLSVLQSATLNTGDSYSFTFTTTGTYDYYCQMHPSMKGVVIVE